MDKGNLYKVEQELEKLANQEKRLLDAYREGIIELDDLREQKAKVAKRPHVVKAKQKAIQSVQEGQGTPDITLSELLDLSAIYKRAMSKADASTKQDHRKSAYQPSEIIPNESYCRRNYPLG